MLKVSHSRETYYNSRVLSSILTKQTPQKTRGNNLSSCIKAWPISMLSNLTLLNEKQIWWVVIDAGSKPCTLKTSSKSSQIIARERGNYPLHVYSTSVATNYTTTTSAATNPTSNTSCWQHCIHGTVKLSHCWLLWHSPMCIGQTNI